MMKKIISYCLIICSLIISLFSIRLENSLEIANSESNVQSDYDISESIQNELYDFLQISEAEGNKTRKNRIPGSKAEYNAALYLQNELSSLTNFKSVNNASTINGVETFEFECIYDGKMYKSQNVIFKRESLVNTNRKVVLAAHYDQAYILQEDGEYGDGGIVSEGVNDSAASVATLLALVKKLDKMPFDYGYDIEVVFFGAGTNDYAGSRYYMRGHTDEMANDILLMINLDKIAVGEHNYIYVNEFKTKQEDYIFKLAKNFKKLKNENTVDYSIESPNGLNYTHIGLESDHAIFMKRNINVASFFSGNYESALTYGYKEFNNKENITFTENDSYLYIKAYYSNFYTNMINVYKAVDLLLSDNEFITYMEQNNMLKVKYGFWNNQNLAACICAIIFVVFVLIYFMIYKNLQGKSKMVLEASTIEDVVQKITKNLSEEENKELNDLINKKLKQDIDKKD